MKWKLLTAIALLVTGVSAVLFALTGGLGSGRASRPTYLTATAATGDVAATVVATGTLDRAATWALAFGVAPSPGTSASSSSGGGSSGTTWSVTDVKVAVGDVVTRGAVLAVADPTSLQRDLAAARANLRAVRIQKTLAAAQLDAATTTDAKRQARIAIDNATAQVSQAEGQVADLAAQITRATIIAPREGTVLEVNVVAGASAPSGAAIVLASGPLQATANFAEGDLSALKVGQPATVTVDAIDATVDGTVSAIAPSAPSASTGGSSVVTFAVTIRLTDPPPTARPGMTAKASVVTASANGVLAVPAVALSDSAGAYRVLVVGADGSVESRDVTVGLVTASQAEITGGLTAGEEVVIGTTAARTQTTTGTGFPGGGVRNAGGGGIPVGPGGQP